MELEKKGRVFFLKPEKGLLLVRGCFCPGTVGQDHLVSCLTESCLQRLDGCGIRPTTHDSEIIQEISRTIHGTGNLPKN